MGYKKDLLYFMGKNFLSGFVIVLGGVAALMGVYAFQGMTTNPSTAGNQSLMSPLLARPGTTYNPDYHSLNLIANFVGIKEPKLTGAKHMFITKTSYTGNLGGLAGADEKCQAEAIAYGIPGIYMAFLSDSTTDFKTRYGADIERKNYEFRGLKELPFISSNIKGFLYGDHNASWDPENYTGYSNNLTNPEKTNITSTNFWSGTDKYGLKKNPGASYTYCNNWTSTTSSAYYGRFSNGEYPNYSYSYTSCTQAYPLLCIEK